jgi:hypothetical protein
MKSVRIMWMGKPLREVYPHATKFQVFKYRVRRAIRWLVIRFSIGAIATAVLVAVYFYGTTQAATVSATNVIVQAQKEEAFPILRRIAMAESHGSQICTKEIARNGWCHTYEIGAPLVHVNTNGTTDIGKYQINSTHLAEAVSMGYNVYEEKDNEAFALYLFKTQGSEPWSSSKAGWKK